MAARLLSAIALALAAAAASCGTGAVDTDGCRRVEEARCRKAPACGIPLEPPYFTSGGDVDSCIRFYDDACLHGLVGNGPAVAEVNACVAAIESDTPGSGCVVVKAPETDTAACGWLVPPAPKGSTPDASAAPAADATTD
jgi:hypothetical protein